MWFNILKIQELVPKEEEVTVELDMDALSESCCEQAKLSFIQELQRFSDENPDNQNLLEMLEAAIDGTYTCDELRGALQVIARHEHPNRHPAILEMRNNMQQILEEWEECESGS